jgi:ACT domain-containing protein
MIFILQKGEHVAKKSGFIEVQIAFALKQAEHGTKVEEACRKLEISDVMFYKWRKNMKGKRLLRFKVM